MGYNLSYCNFLVEISSLEILVAGLPLTIEFLKTFLFTTARAAITELFSMHTPGPIKASAATQTPSPIVMGLSIKGKSGFV